MRPIKFHVNTGNQKYPIIIGNNIINKIQTFLNELQGYQLSIKIIPDMFDILSGKVKTSNLFGTPLIILRTDIMPYWQKRVKRLIDLTFTFCGFIILSPVGRLVVNLSPFTS